MKNYKSIKVEEGTYHNIIAIQHLLWERQKLQINKANLLEFLVHKFKTKVEQKESEI